MRLWANLTWHVDIHLQTTQSLFNAGRNLSYSTSTALLYWRLYALGQQDYHSAWAVCLLSYSGNTSFPLDSYMVTVPVAKTITALLQWPAAWACSPELLRQTQLWIFSIGTFYILVGLFRLLRHDNPSLVAFSLSLYPVLFFFKYLYYTDVGSVFYVLLAYRQALRHRTTSSALAAGMSIWFRQTNAIWTAFVMAVVLVRTVLQSPWTTVSERTLLDQSVNPFKIVWCLLKAGLRQPLYVLKQIWCFLAVLSMFVGFVFWNGGIVLGDKANHQVGMHVPQVFYFVSFACFFLIPHFRWSLIQQPAWTARSILVTLLLLAGILAGVHYGTLEHPFLLSDNRHYSFYVWKNIFRQHIAVRYVLTPVYLVCFVFMKRLMDLNEQPLWWQLLFAGATALSLVPSPLLEFRYFIIPYLIYRIHVRARSWRVGMEIVLFMSINAVTLWMFLYRSFEWKQEPGVKQRFLW